MIRQTLLLAGSSERLGSTGAELRVPVEAASPSRSALEVGPVGVCAGMLRPEPNIGPGRVSSPCRPQDASARAARATIPRRIMRDAPSNEPLAPAPAPARFRRSSCDF